jgi:hypothetical protein
VQEVQGDGQKPHSQGPGMRGEVAHDSEAHRYAAYGKCGACAPTDPVLLLMPFGSHLAVDTLPSGYCEFGGYRSALAVSGFRLRARLGVSIPSVLSPAREALPPRSDMTPLIRASEGLEPS